MRLEGWRQHTDSRPSFETHASAPPMHAPQDEVGDQFDEPKGRHVQSARSSRGGPRHRRDLCHRRGRLYAAVADLADHQFRAGRIRDAAGVPDAGGDAGRRAVLARHPDRHPAVDAAARPRLQDAAGRPDAAPWRAAAGHRHHGAGDRHQGGGETVLQRRGFAVSLHRPHRRRRDRRPGGGAAKPWGSGPGDPGGDRPHRALEPYLGRSPDAGDGAESERWRASSACRWNA